MAIRVEIGVYKSAGELLIIGVHVIAYNTIGDLNHRLQYHRQPSSALLPLRRTRGEAEPVEDGMKPEPFLAILPGKTRTQYLVREMLTHRLSS